MMMAFATVIPCSSSTSSHLYFPRKRPNFRNQQQTFRCSSSLSTPSSTSSKQIQFDLKTYWITLIAEINHKLEEAIPIKYPEQIYESMRYSVLAKGAKRAPPVMCIASAELFGIPRRAAFPTACALEMVHAASLIHDDLPCMDDDISRRGRPTNHAIFGEDMAILAGDALFPLGFQHIVTNTPSDLVPESRILRVIAEFARAVGSTGMAAGQFLDLTNGGENSVEFVQEKKFGEMAECSAACGGLLAGAEDDEVARLRRYGRAVGVLYQVVDDVLEAKMKREKGEEGKRRGKTSYVGVYGVDRALEMVDELRVKAKRELDGFEKYGERVAPLYSFVDYAVERGFVVVGDQNDDGGILAADQNDCMAAL
ncbi:Polyprenyl synthetase [Macleaya cordata]|uniref:Polyprenyl synthetase n=1 Tax=Macleaya cordata TaxID=56857 RepID=A0A200QEG9_MACCD|nr:Polyprenyl synthetase [Macleaya cordata]